jgi:glycerol-3-phosphate dehydrogenase subunit B
VTSTGWAAPSYDVLVIGAGLAGLTAATRLAESGAKVMVLAKGVGATHLGPGTIDVLGYADGRDEVIERPGEALAGLDGEHPYARLGGAATVGRAIDWFKTQFDGGVLPDYRYTGSLDENIVLPSTVGAPKPSAVVPETMAAGDLRQGGAMLIVGFHVLRDFHAPYLADNVSRGGVPARGIVLDRRVDGRPEANALGLAKAFDDPERRRLIVDDVARGAGDEARIGFPAALGAEDPHKVWQDLEDRLGRPVFEIPTLPPSVPGMRVFRTLRDRLRGHGGRIILNSVVMSAARTNGRIDAINATAAARELTYRAKWIVLATGGVASGGIELDSHWQARETALGLPLHGVPAPDEARFGADYFGEHAFARAGVAVDERLRPVGPDGAPVAENVLVAGATLAGARPWKEKSGDGVSLASGYRAAELIMEESA